MELKSLFDQALKYNPEVFNEKLLKKYKTLESKYDKVRQEKTTYKNRYNDSQKEVKKLKKELEEKNWKQKQMSREQKELREEFENALKKLKEDEKILNALYNEQKEAQKNLEDIEEQYKRKLDVARHANSRNSDLPSSKNELSHSLPVPNMRVFCRQI